MIPGITRHPHLLVRLRQRLASSSGCAVDCGQRQIIQEFTTLVRQAEDQERAIDASRRDKGHPKQ